MIDPKPIYRKEKTMDEVCGHLSLDELRDFANEVTDTLLALIADCSDADVVFVPDDPKAQDDAADSETEVNIAWTLGHLIVHVTASAEEAAFLAAELARGVQREGRSRYETHWESINTIAQCRTRLEESRRQILATLEVWPDQPHMENTIELSYLTGPINPASRFCGGLLHGVGHVAQIKDVIGQAKAA